jgi:hypothetical protein
LAALRRSVVRGAPLGEDSWRERTAKRLGLTSTLRPRGRPQNRRVGTAHQYLGSDAVPGIWWAVPTLPGSANRNPKRKRGKALALPRLRFALTMWRESARLLKLIVKTHKGSGACVLDKGSAAWHSDCHAATLCAVAGERGGVGALAAVGRAWGSVWRGLLARANGETAGPDVRVASARPPAEISRCRGKRLAPRLDVLR